MQKVVRRIRSAWKTITWWAQLLCQEEKKVLSYYRYATLGWVQKARDREKWHKQNEAYVRRLFDSDDDGVTIPSYEDTFL